MQMAVLVEFACPGATAQQLQQAEVAGMQRGERLGGPPYPGCMFLAVTSGPTGPRFTSAWRTEREFRVTFADALQEDLVGAGMEVDEPVVTAVLAMAIPGAHPG
jgi:hypothetical protein